MQLMTWTLARLGSRFSLLFEPHNHRIRHSALGRSFSEPTDLMVGLVEPDGTERVLPFSTRGNLLGNIEQFDRLNSITFRGTCPGYQLRFELNIHSVFYPQDEPLCTLPAFYLEMRVSPTQPIGNTHPAAPTPKKVTLFIRLDRANTQITTAAGDPETPGTAASFGQIDLAYHGMGERIVSMNPGCRADPDGKGLTLDLPVTEAGSGTKWRLVWGAHCSVPMENLDPGWQRDGARLRYLAHWANLDAVMDDAVRFRDDRLAHSRRLEKLIEQTPLSMAQRHLLNQGFQAFLDNTIWCGFDNGSDRFAVDEKGPHGLGSVDVGYHTSLVFLAMWPDLLAKQLEQWSQQESPHDESGGSWIQSDTHQVYAHATDWPLKNTCQYLLLLQAYTHWTGNLTPAQKHARLVDQLARYLIWADRDASGFPSGNWTATSKTTDRPGHAIDRSTHMAITRVAALQAASDLLARTGHDDRADACRHVAATDVQNIEARAWMGDHYTYCISQAETCVLDTWSTQTLNMGPASGRDAYGIETGSGLLLPTMTAQSVLFNIKHLQADLANAARETLAAYGCGDRSDDIEDCWISKNLWRDHLSLYLHRGHPAWHQRYWDLQVMSNTHKQSQGYCDTYVGHDMTFSPRGATGFGFLLACPRLVIDRLAPGGTHISVHPNRHFAKRWPLLPLADWKAGKIPVCVVDTVGNVTIEGQSDAITVHGDQGSSAAC